MATSPILQTPNPATKAPSKPPTQILTETEAQWLFTPTELLHTPSISDGMPHSHETSLRTKGSHFILQVGLMLKIPQTTLATAATFFNRFLMRHSIQKTPANPKPLHHYQIAATALLLATKTDETIRRTKDIITACCRVAQKNPTLQIDEQNKDYWKWRDTLLYNEDILLEALCFDLTVESPFRVMYEMMTVLGVQTDKRLRNAAWAFLCDSVGTEACLLFRARVVAGAALYCGARFAGRGLPGMRARGDAGAANTGAMGAANGNEMANSHGVNGSAALGGDANSKGDNMPEVKINGTNSNDPHPETPWWETVGVRLHDVKKACNYLAEIYEESGSSTNSSSSKDSPNIKQQQETQQRENTGATGNHEAAAAGGTLRQTGQQQTGQAQEVQSQDVRIYANLREELSDEEEEDGEIDEGEDGEEGGGNDENDDDGEVRGEAEAGGLDPVKITSELHKTNGLGSSAAGSSRGTKRRAEDEIG